MFLHALNSYRHHGGCDTRGGAPTYFLSANAGELQIYMRGIVSTPSSNFYYRRSLILSASSRLLYPLKHSEIRF